jgi:hypothetical protein
MDKILEVTGEKRGSNIYLLNTRCRKNRVARLRHGLLHAEAYQQYQEGSIMCNDIFHIVQPLCANSNGKKTMQNKAKSSSETYPMSSLLLTSKGAIRTANYGLRN